jgi:hypothetical protein
VPPLDLAWTNSQTSPALPRELVAGVDEGERHGENGGGGVGVVVVPPLADVAAHAAISMLTVVFAIALTQKVLLCMHGQ